MLSLPPPPPPLLSSPKLGSLSPPLCTSFSVLFPTNTLRFPPPTFFQPTPAVPVQDQFGDFFLFDEVNASPPFPINLNGTQGLPQTSFLFASAPSSLSPPPRGNKKVFAPPCHPKNRRTHKVWGLSPIPDVALNPFFSTTNSFLHPSF